jgi:hypothetical protein
MLRELVLGLWWHTLFGRTQKRLSWMRMLKLGTGWLPQPRVLHPYQVNCLLLC